MTSADLSLFTFTPPLRAGISSNKKAQAKYNVLISLEILPCRLRLSTLRPKAPGLRQALSPKSFFQLTAISAVTVHYSLSITTLISAGIFLYKHSSLFAILS